MMEEKQLEDGLKKAFKYLSYRGRTIFEVSNYLESKGYSEEVVQSIIDKLCKMKYLDDYQFALDYLKYQVDKGNYGPKLLEYKLYQKGVPSEVISKTVEIVLDEAVEFEMARRLLKKKYENPGEMTYEDRQKIGAYLSRKGFSYDIIIKVLNIEGDTI